MSGIEWLRGIPAGGEVPAGPDEADARPLAPPGPEAPAGGSSVIAGERGIPSVSRERSVRARIGNVLAIGTVVLLGGSFLSWYYATQFGKVRDAREAAQRVTEARAGGEMRLPPLGRLDPPHPAVAAAAPLPVSFGDMAGPAPPPPPVPSPPPAAAAQKTPAELALERKLGQPVLLHARTAVATAPVAGRPPAAGEPGSTALGAMLRPTATAPVEARLLPERRLLLAKGAFVDCTLETAIDSTHPGMTTCVGAGDVYGADGKVVLLERGTRYIGETRGEARQGQARVFVLWAEARTPAGVVVRLDSPGTDELGRSGVPGHVDTHFWDRFGAAILLSVIDGGLQALAQAQGGGATVRFGTTGPRDVMAEVLRGTVAIPPTIVKNQGERIQILVARDVDFRPVYALSASAE